MLKVSYSSNIDPAKYTNLKTKIEKAVENELKSIFNEIKVRVFTEGRDENNTKIGGGKYSTRPTVIDTKGIGTPPYKVNNKKVAQKTKDGDYFFWGGYKSFKEAVNASTNVVNLTLTGELKNSFRYSKVNGVWYIGFPASQAAKLSNILKRYGNVFGLTRQQRERLRLAVTNQLKNIK